MGAENTLAMIWTGTQAMIYAVIISHLMTDKDQEAPLLNATIKNKRMLLDVSYNVGF